MPRANSSVPRHRRHRKIVKQAKGYYGVRKSNFRAAKDAVERSLQFSYRDRRQKKRTIRSLWIVRINAAVREHGLNYSTFVNLLKNKNIMMNRKTLAYLAVNDKDAFDAIVKSVS
ncbi:MAG: 50S ribosomal protein L20 [Candidatus Marinimicrobia bacterium]|nr:50S ribosomal protein L20 [Candidatus Neomarinimicrobiota bacterium]|tara:strand:- start:129 stop:473 length:345 start_codon:yes stop_codon:yes gene_type:complete